MIAFLHLLRLTFARTDNHIFVSSEQASIFEGSDAVALQDPFLSFFLEELRDITTSFNLKLYSEHNSRDLLKLTCSITAKKNTTPKLYFTKKRRRKRKSKRLLQKQLPYRSETSALLRGPSTVSKTIYGQGTKKTGICKPLGSCDRAS